MSIYIYIYIHAYISIYTQTRPTAQHSPHTDICVAQMSPHMQLRKRKHQGLDTMQAPNSPHLALLATPCSLPPTMCAAHAFCKPPASSTAPAVLPLRALSCAGNAGIRVQTTFKPLTCPTSPSLQNPTLCRRPYSPPEQFARTQHRAHRLLCCHDARRRALEAQVSGFKQHTLHHSRSNRSR